MRTAGDLFLGTVKLGMPEYGFFSKRDDFFNPLQFLHSAAALGVTRFDTSPRYGNSESVIGKYIQKSSSRPFVASKIDNLTAKNPATPRIMEESVKNSLSKLHLPVLDICYLHQNDIDIISDGYVHKGLKLLKEKGLIRQAGASLYSKEECSYARDSGVFDVIQLPVSVFDLGLYNHFFQKGPVSVTFIARSLLLQGILANREQIKGRIRQAGEILEYLKSLDKVAEKCGTTTLDLALAFAYGLEGINYFIIGTTSFENLKRNVESMEIQLPPDVINELVALASVEKEWTNPRNWKYVD